MPMSEYICNLSLRVRNPSEAYRIRDAIREFVDDQDDSRVASCGRSCIDPTFTDIEIRAKSRGIANRVVAAVRSIYACSCEIDCEMIV
jgi:hypothetical protein